MAHGSYEHEAAWLVNHVEQDLIEDEENGDASTTEAAVTLSQAILGQETDTEETEN